MTLGTLLQGSIKTIAPSHVTPIAIPKQPCSLFARPIVPKVSCKYFPSVATTADRNLTCVRPEATLLKQNALAKQDLVDFCRRPLFSDRWIEACICEIVKHIHEAPFLQMIVNHEDTSTISMTQRQRVPAGNALSADEKWMQVKSNLSEASPDAVILVHDLCDSYIECHNVEGLDKRSTGLNGKEGMSNGTQLWGVLLLGKTIAESACYILETTSIASCFGICTHFCLTKSQSFGPSWSDQIQRSWLLKTEV